MAKSDAAVAEVPETPVAESNVEPKKARKPRDVRYHVVRTIYFRTHKSVTKLPNLVPGIENWATESKLVATVTNPVARKGDNKGKAREDELIITLDTPESFAESQATGTGISREESAAVRSAITNPAVIEKAKELGISPAELVKQSLAKMLGVDSL